MARTGKPDSMFRRKGSGGRDFRLTDEFRRGFADNVTGLMKNAGKFADSRAALTDAVRELTDSQADLSLEPV